jgi:ElaA protein
MLNIKSFEELTNVELYQIIMLREQVFVVEQNCPYLDCDGKDLTSMHLWFSKDAVCAAYSRIVPPQYEKDLWSIGRVVVHPDFRGLALGKAIMQAAIDYLKLNKGSKEIQISAQVYLLRFYNELGFHEVGATYLEDDIPHIKMIYGEVES